MDEKNLPIGVFDSGIGGLTVLDKLIKTFPNEDFVYIGDTKNLPYGTKTNEEVKKFVTSIVSFLEKYPVKAIVIACNTATVNSYHLLESISIPLIEVIRPTAIYALSVSENILVLGTEITINAKGYENVINDLKKEDSSQYYCSCSEFVTAIENNIIDCDESYELVSKKLNLYKNKKIDCIILGCTHFDYYKKEIQNIFKKAKLISCSTPTSLFLKEVLKKENLLREKSGQNITIYLTKNQENFKEKTEWFKYKYTFIDNLEIKE